MCEAAMESTGATLASGHHPPTHRWDSRRGTVRMSCSVGHRLELRTAMYFHWVVVSAAFLGTNPVHHGQWCCYNSIAHASLAHESSSFLSAIAAGIGALSTTRKRYL